MYLINGRMLTELCKNEGTVYNCNPPDFEFDSMARALGDVLKILTVYKSDTSIGSCPVSTKEIGITKFILA